MTVTLPHVHATRSDFRLIATILAPLAMAGAVIASLHEAR
jgi:hypothetical protein